MCIEVSTKYPLEAAITAPQEHRLATPLSRTVSTNVNEGRQNSQEECHPDYAVADVDQQ